MMRRTLAAALAAVLLGAAPRPIVFSAPAGTRPAGAPNAARPYDTILPNGRTVSPVGTSVVVGMNALGVALSPDGRYAIVANAAERQQGMHPNLDPRIEGAFSLAVVDARTMRVVSVRHVDGEKYFAGIAALRDPADPSRTIVLVTGGASNVVRVFDLADDGTLAPDGAPIAMPLPNDPQLADAGRAFPSALTLSADGRTAYVANDLSGTAVSIDIASRRVASAVQAGFFPSGIAVAGGRVLVTNEGLMQYGVLARPARIPRFAAPPFDPGRSSSLTSFGTLADGRLDAAGPQSLQMDVAPDELQNVGGAHPTAIAVSKDGRYAFVCMTNVDRIAVVALGATPRVVGGISLRLFQSSPIGSAPYGTQPNAIVRSADGRRLYVALAGINAVAVLDSSKPTALRRLGLVPTGWYPTALALSPDGRYLYVANAKGIGQEPGFRGAPPYKTSGSGRILQSLGDSNTIWATLQRVDLHGLALPAVTLSALRYTRSVAYGRADALVPAMRLTGAVRSSKIRHVVLILEENKTFDAMLGDLTDASGARHGNGDPSLVSFPESVTPNLHALARRFGVADNFYADGDESDAGHQFAAGGVATAYSEKTLLDKSGRAPMVNKNEDPEDYPRAGYIFNGLERAGRTYRDYGDLVRLSGYDEGGAPDPRADDPAFAGPDDRSAPTSGLGGLYALDVPALGALASHVDLDYPGWNLRIRDERRAREFVRDFGPLAAGSAMPDFTYIWLPADHGGAGPDIPPLSEEVADGDRALGTIVEYLSHAPQWSSTAIFVMPDDAQSTRDHVSEHRSYAIVISPYAKRGYVGHRHLSTVSVLKTEEELLGLPPLALNDLLADDLADFFTPQADAAPYTAIPVPTQTASLEGRRIAALLVRTDQSAADADVERSARLIGLSREADRLAQRRGGMAPATYAREQQALYEAALRVLTTSANGEK